MALRRRVGPRQASVLIHAASASGAVGWLLVVLLLRQQPPAVAAVHRVPHDESLVAAARRLVILLLLFLLDRIVGASCRGCSLSRRRSGGGGARFAGVGQVRGEWRVDKEGVEPEVELPPGVDQPLGAHPHQAKVVKQLELGGEFNLDVPAQQQRRAHLELHLAVALAHGVLGRLPTLLAAVLTDLQKRGYVHLGAFIATRHDMLVNAPTNVTSEEDVIDGGA